MVNIYVDIRDAIERDEVTKIRPKIVAEYSLFEKMVGKAKRDVFEEFPDISKNVAPELDRDIGLGLKKVGTVNVLYYYSVDGHDGSAVGTYPAYSKFGKIFVVIDIVSAEREKDTNVDFVYYSVYAEAYESFFNSSEFDDCKERGDFFASPCVDKKWWKT